jgi:hypothetical protein
MKPNTNQPWWRLPLIALGAPVAIALLAAAPMLLFMPAKKTVQVPPPAATPAPPPEPAVPVAAPATREPAFQSMARPDDPKFKVQAAEQAQAQVQAQAQAQVAAQAPNASVNNDLNNADVSFRGNYDGSEQSGCGWVQSAIATATREPISEDQSRQLKSYASRCRLRY